MENASKALVIAGAILISILIIGLGVFIYNGAASTVKNANLHSQEAQAQNGQFETYFGTHVGASEVKQLLSLVRSNNITGSTSGEDKRIFINDYNSTEFSIKNGDYFTVEVKNDKAVEPSTEADQEPSPNTKAPNGDAGYYKNGFIRNISIKNNRNNAEIKPVGSSSGSGSGSGSGSSSGSGSGSGS